MINVKYQLPAFVREDYPGFVDFLKAYYKWVEEEYSIGVYSDLVDIDSTITDFLKYFRKELDIFQITNDETSRFYLRHLKELYTAKGSVQAFDFLFNILFNKEATIKIPWDRTLILSNGKWTVDASIVLDITEEEARAINGKELLVYDDAGDPYKVMVEYINLLPNGLVEVFVSKPHALKTIDRVDGLSNGEVTLSNPTTIKRVASITIVDGGTGFEVGQIFEIPSETGSGLTIRITSVGFNGEILGVEILTFGTGYTEAFSFGLAGGAGGLEVSFYPIINTILSAITIYSDSVYIKGSADSTLVLADYGFVTADAGVRTHQFATGDAAVYRNGGGDSIGGLTNEEIYYVIRIDEDHLQLALTHADALAGIEIDLTSVDDSLPRHLGPAHTLTPIADGILRFNLGSVTNYPGHYKSGSSILGDGCFIEDSYYYQVYSYVTALEEVRDKYETILRTVLHPSGTKHFGEYTVLNELYVGVSMDLEYSFDNVVPL